MKLSEYAACDALGLAEIVAKGDVSPRELAETAARAVEAVDGDVNAVVETYPDRIENLNEAALGNGPFRGVPFLIKDIFGHEKGRKVEFGSKLCEGMLVEENTHVGELLNASGLNILGRSNAPEYSMAGTAENALYGNTSNPWKKGYSAGGSSGGGTAAVMAGIVPIAHGTDIAGSIRIPASWCGGIGLKPSRGRVSFGPMLDENGFGLAMNFVQSKSMRDTAVMLDCMAIPQTGDPFAIPKPDTPYADFLDRPAKPLRIGWSADALMGVETDAEIVAAVQQTAVLLADMGHEVVEKGPELDGLSSARKFADIWFFGFDLRLQNYSSRSGHPISEDTLEPVIWHVYQHAQTLSSSEFMGAMGELNRARRRLAVFYDDCDIWLSPTTAKVAEPFGNYNLGRTDVDMENIVPELLAVPCQFTLPHNIMGTPALSLPLVMHSTGLPIGIQLGARVANEHVLLQLGRTLEEALPWKDRIPPLHVSNT